MGIRPEKYIGWTIATDTDSVDTAQLETVIAAKHGSKNTSEYTYRNFFDFIHGTPAGKRIEALDTYSAKLDDYSMMDYVDIVHSGVDGMDHNQLYLVFYPMMLMPYAFPEGQDGTAEFRDTGTPFVMAELENFFPEYLETLQPFSYTVNTPVFPSDYTVLHRNEQKTVQDFQVFEDREYYRDVQQVLRQLQRGEREKADQYVRLTKFDSAAALEAALCLGPPAETFMFAQFLNLFEDESVAYELKPSVVYAWS